MSDLSELNELSPSRELSESRESRESGELNELSPSRELSESRESSESGERNSPRSLAQRDRHRRSREHGSITIVVALTASLVIGIMSFGVDFGLWLVTSNRMQRATDLAAVAAAEAQGRGASSSAVEAVARDTLASNGIDASTSGITISTMGTSHVVVKVVDPNPPMFFSKLLIKGASITKQSAATFGTCLGHCDRTLLISPPTTLDLKSTGDGMVPVMIDDKVYTINHHTSGNYIVCYKIDGTVCPGYPTGVGGETSMVVGLQVYERNQELWFTVDRIAAKRSTTLECWDTREVRSCGSWLLGDSQDQPNWYSLRQWVSSVPTRIGEKLYFFDALAHSFLCFDMVGRAPCAGFPKADTTADGLDQSKMAAADPEWPTLYALGSKIYHSYLTPEGVYLLCNDANSGESCGGFNRARLSFNSPDGTWGSNVFFPLPNATGTIVGFCGLVRYSPSYCVDLNGWSITTPAWLEAALPPSSDRAATIPWVGVTTGLFPAYMPDKLYCVDFAQQRSCGAQGGFRHPYSAQPLGTDNCALLLGHEAQLFAIDPRNLAACVPSQSKRKIWPCDCRNGSSCWGVLEIAPEDLAKFASLRVTVRNPSGGVALGPVDLIASGGKLDMSKLPLNVEFLELEFSSTAKTGVTWSQGITAKLVVTERAVLE